MKKLFSIMAIAALVFAGTLTANAASQTMPTGTQTLLSTATVSFIQDEEATTVEEPQGWHHGVRRTTRHVPARLFGLFQQHRRRADIQRRCCHHQRFPDVPPVLLA